MNNCLLLITSNFPYGKGEEFLETELKYMSEEFDIIYILTFSLESNVTRNLPENVLYSKIYRNKLTTLQKIKAISFLLSKQALEELYIIKNRYRLKHSKAIIKSVIVSEWLSRSICKQINDILKRHFSGNIYLYSYWMNQGAYAIARYKEKNMEVKAYTRCHRHDLYFERNKNNYLPFRKYIISNLDKVFSISQDGKRYLENKVPGIDPDKIVVSRLGVDNTRNYFVSPIRNVLHLVSCSFVASVKRLHLIVDTLSTISEININWVHIGDGIEKENVEFLASSKLSGMNNITYTFVGHLTNEEVYNYYSSSNFDLFINLSESEGVPVSMMEAFSFSIPIVATNVGGVTEIVNNENGILLSPDPTIAEIKNAILFFGKASDDMIANYRNNAFKTWKELYNAKTNYQSFIAKIKGGKYE